MDAFFDKLERQLFDLETRLDSLDIALYRAESGDWQPPTQIPSDMGPTQHRLAELSQTIGLRTSTFVRVPSDYYDRSLEERCKLVGGPSVSHLCKTVIMENTRWQPIDGLNEFQNPRFVCFLVQYVAKLNAEKIAKAMSEQYYNSLIGKSKMNWRLASPEDSLRLSGFEHNAVVPIGKFYCSRSCFCSNLSHLRLA